MPKPKQPRQEANGTSTSVAIATAIASQTVADILASWPQTVPVFMRYRLACVGCPISRFEIIADIAAIYGINPDPFLQELQQAIEDNAGGSRSRKWSSSIEKGGKAG